MYSIESRNGKCTKRKRRFKVECTTFLSEERTCPESILTVLTRATTNKDLSVRASEYSPLAPIAEPPEKTAR